MVTPLIWVRVFVRYVKLKSLGRRKFVFAFLLGRDCAEWVGV
jgi:hypothetical protein